MTPLHAIGAFVRELFLLVPMGVVRALFLAVPVLLLVWVLRRKSDPDEPAALSRQLRIWASVALLVQIAIYWLMA